MSESGEFMERELKITTYEVENQALDLKNLILKSEEYQEYDTNKKILQKDSVLFEMVKEYQKENFYLQNNVTENFQNEVKELTEKYQNILKSTLVIEYLSSEIRLCRMIQRVVAVLVEDVELELDFLD